MEHEDEDLIELLTVDQLFGTHIVKTISKVESRFYICTRKEKKND